MSRMQVMAGAKPFSFAGTGEAARVGVLLCHGYTGTPQSLRPWAEHLAARGHAVELPRLPGHGTRWQEMNRTEWTDWYAALDGAFRDLQARCDHVVVAGLSMGGLLATRLAEVHGEQVSGLVLVNAIFTHDNPALRLLPVLHRVVPSFPGIASDIKKEGVQELAYARNPLRAMRSQTQAWRVVEADLPRVVSPALFFHSREDHVVPTHNVHFFADRVGSPDVTTVELLESYHVATLDTDAPLIFATTDDFIARVCGRPQQQGASEPDVAAGVAARPAARDGAP